MSQPRAHGVAPPLFQLPDATRLGPVHLQVSDLPRSLDYYQRVLGMHAEPIGDGSAALRAPGQSRPLLTLRSAPGITAARRSAFGLYHFALLLPDRVALGGFAAHLAAENLRVGKADHLVSEALYLWDPDGLGIEVYADRPRAAWQYLDREFVMTTDPLDLAKLIAESEGRVWDALPKETTMGHVHLQVGELNKAEAFYHRALGLDKTVWTYPGALFMSAGGYHHHLGTNVWSQGPTARPNEARLLAWELVVPSQDTVTSAAQSLRSAGHACEDTVDGVRVADPWGTQLLVRSE